MKKINYIKWVFAVVLLLMIGIFGCTFIVNQGEYAVVTRFGAARAEITSAGLNFKLPWPFEVVRKFDARKQYYDTGYVETLTKDKKNVILQTYVVWSIEDPLTFFTRVGDKANGEKFLGDLLTNAKNGVMGNFDLSSLVSLKAEDLKINEIESLLQTNIASHAASEYGIKLYEAKIRRIGFPEANIQSVYEQMKSDRQKNIDQLIAEGTRDANIIRSTADADAAKIVAEGKEKAATINAATEKDVAQIYADAYKLDPTLYQFLRKLAALENSLDSKTVIIAKSSEEPFDALKKD